jgi:hypothetical protein
LWGFVGCVEVNVCEGERKEKEVGNGRRSQVRNHSPHPQSVQKRHQKGKKSLSLTFKVNQKKGTLKKGVVDTNAPFFIII